MPRPSAAQTPEWHCDDRVLKLSGFVPQRFATAWTEGNRTDVVISKAERDPALRKSALKKYGEKCMHTDCDSVIKHVSQLDVHHLNPIAEGVRKTTLNDVAVLCANCHRLAHVMLKQGQELLLTR